jgi:hypothetical protein
MLYETRPYAVQPAFTITLYYVFQLAGPVNDTTYPDGRSMEHKGEKVV